MPVHSTDAFRPCHRICGYRDNGVSVSMLSFTLEKVASCVPVVEQVIMKRRKGKEMDFTAYERLRRAVS